MNTEELAIALEEKRPEMIRLAASKLRRHGLEHDAEDFVQDAMMEIIQGVAEGRHTVDEGVGPIFATVIVRDIANRLFVDKRRVELTDEYTRIYQPDSQAQIQQRERLKLDVDVVLEQLDGQTAQIVRLAWLEGYNWKEIKTRLKISEDTISSSLKTALPILQAGLARYDHRQRITPISVPRPYTKRERQAIAESIRKDRRARQPGPVTVTTYTPAGDVLAVVVQSVSTYRKLRVSHVSSVPAGLSTKGGETDSTGPEVGSCDEMTAGETVFPAAA